VLIDSRQDEGAMSEEKKGQPPQEQERQPGREYEMDPEPDYAPRYPGSGRLTDKVAIVTGGDSGIGRAVSVLFAREGARIAIVYKEEERDARDTQALVEAEGSEALLIAGDVGRKSFCEEAVAKTVERFGRLDVLVNNAAEQYESQDFADVPEEQIETTFRTNIFGYMFMTQAALPHLKDGAAIVNTTSITAYRGSPHLVDYASTKGAIVAFTRSLSGQVAEKGIRVNGVAPGPIWTPLIPASFSAEKVAEFGTDVPLGRAGQPNEVAPSFLFLACEDSSYFSGQVLHPNGGVVINT
jgi:NAD(P)-dependent dehydrogenase (short-subunit alcohol dehydrogenase family)